MNNRTKKRCLKMKNKIILAAFLAISIFLAGCTQQFPFAPEGNSNPPQTFTLAEVSQHNNPSDCWIVLRNRVYNVTELVSKDSNNRFAKECGKPIQGFGNGFPNDGNSNRPRPPNDFNRPMDFNRQRPPGDFNRQRNGMQNPLNQYYLGDIQQ